MSTDLSAGEQHRLIANTMNEGSPQARALGFQTLEIGERSPSSRFPIGPRSSATRRPA
jgi:hypothetical protein